MTREEELKELKQFITKNGVTQLPPDARGPETMMSVWRKSKKGRKKKSSVPKKSGK